MLRVTHSFCLLSFQCLVTVLVVWYKPWSTRLTPLFIVIYYLKYCYFHTWKKVSRDNKLCCIWLNENLRFLFLELQEACSGSVPLEATANRTFWVSSDSLQLRLGGKHRLLNHIFLLDWTDATFSNDAGLLPTKQKREENKARVPKRCTVTVFRDSGEI